jgi:FAD/FMN-containing dehydrogenase
MAGGLRPAPDATAYPHRDAEYVMNVHARWESPSDDSACIEWARDYFEATKPHASGGVYVNFVPDGEEPVEAEYGPNYDRLVALKRKYDPTNLFRINQNVVP